MACWFVLTSAEQRRALVSLPVRYKKMWLVPLAVSGAFARHECHVWRQEEDQREQRRPTVGQGEGQHEQSQVPIAPALEDGPG